MTDQRHDSIQVTLVNSEFHWGCLQDHQGGLWAAYRWLHRGRALSQILTVYGPARAVSYSSFPQGNVSGLSLVRVSYG